MLFNGNNLGEIEHIVGNVNAQISYPSPVNYFRVMKYDGQSLIVCGSSNPSLHHELEIKFNEVFHFNGDFDWARNVHKTFLYIADFYDDEYNHGRNARLKFAIQTDDFYYHSRENKIVIWARGISYSTEKVVYARYSSLAEEVKSGATGSL